MYNTCCKCIVLTATTVPSLTLVHRYIDNKGRPDIAFHDADLGITKELDISMAHPCSKDTVKGIAKECGYATAKREAIKTNKYCKDMKGHHDAKKCYQMGQNLLLSPLCLNILDDGGEGRGIPG